MTDLKLHMQKQAPTAQACHQQVTRRSLEISIAHRWRTVFLFVALLCLAARIPSSQAFLPLLPTCKSQQQSTNTCLVVVVKMTSIEDSSDMASTSSSTASSSSSSSSSSMSVTDRFHADMRRVLESRRHYLQAQQTPQETLLPLHERHGDTNTMIVDRNQRPAVLDTDVDGAERVHGLLRILCQRELATEESFQIVMRAYVQRGRLRWRPSAALVVPEGDTHDDDAINENDKNVNNQTTVDGNYLATRKVICAADQVEALWQEFVRKRPGTPLSMETYNLVLEAYANCATPRGGERNYARRAQALYERLVAMHGETAVPTTSLLHVLHATAWQQANLQPGVYATQAQEYLQKICERTRDPRILLQAYSWTLEAFSKSGSAKSATTADELLKEMIQINATQTDSSNGGILDTQDFANAVLAWSKANEPDAAPRAQAWLENLIKLYQEGKFPIGSEPPLIAFNGVIVAWSRRGDYSRAAAVLWLLDDVRKSCSNLQPDAVSYNSVLHAYFRAKAPLDKVMVLVNFMHKHCDAQPSIRPNSFTYYTYLKCLLQSHSGSKGRSEDDEEIIMSEREETLNRLERCWTQGDYEMEPTNRIFNMMINSYAKSNDKRAWRKAMHLLERMKTMSSHSEHLSAVKPDIITITSVMECLSKASDPQAPQMAQTLLQSAFDRYHETHDVNDRPNLRTYTMAILTLAKNHGSVVEARKLLDNLIELYKETEDPSLKPNAYPYNYVLNCAASTSSDDPGEAFQVATRTFQDLRQAGLADSFSYAFWIKCCIHLVTANDLKENCVRYAFDECKRQGLVTAEVLKRLFQALPRHVVMEEMLEGKVSTNLDRGSSSHAPVALRDLPKAWTRKAPKSWRQA